MTMTLYGIPNCDTVKKARTWLDANGVDYAFHDFKKAGLDSDTIKGWLADVAWDVLVNRKGTTWRALSDDRKASVVDARSATELMLESPSVIKRPVLSHDSGTHVGFSADTYQQIFKK
ncbi:ArsC family reductase [Noviherbaspirillum cavernae]|uniref:ArsC family reductase n=1 Tax=Noviherbaspirillum cavernae TaxID=2320862 RepID=A0A418X199_9BURK|nr:ArsC family reductase [Noviherbaspirillum cavernae]RJG06215.1 ArsC family reductase [Noviherbaspirillum cavernae]